jgi:DinB superfamily
VAHLLVDQLRFSRSELVRSLDGVTDEEGVRRFGSMNSISWMVGHLADQEQRYWLERRGEPLVVPGLNDLVGYGKPASTPLLSEMWEAWRGVTAATDSYLDSLAIPDLLAFPTWRGKTIDESVGTLILRVNDHYWFHIGEAQAVRQMLGHTGLPDFVGDIGEKAPYRPEAE